MRIRIVGPTKCAFNADPDPKPWIHVFHFLGREGDNISVDFTQEWLNINTVFTGFLGKSWQALYHT